MSYGDKVLSRVLTPGFAVVILGALLVFLSGLLTRNVPQEKRQKAELTVKAAGTLVVVIGMLIMFV